MIRFSCMNCRRTFSAVDPICPRCSDFRKSFRMAAAVCGTCPGLIRGKSCQGCGDLEKECDIEKVWIGEIACPRGRQSNIVKGNLPSKPRRKRALRQPFPKRSRRSGVGFIAVAYMPIGGTEVWHQTLIPRLENVAGFVALEPSLAAGDFSKLPCETGIGLAAARRLAANVETLVVWGVGKRLEEIVKGNRPRVISVSHCDSRSEWTTEMMDAQKPWTDHAVYLCPSGAETVPAGIPCTFIPNAPDPARVAATVTRQESRQRLGVAPDEKLLVSVSRLSPEKQVAKLISAMEYLPDSYRLAVAGTSSGWSQHHGPELRKLAGDRVQFLGNVDPPGDLLAAADAFLSASEYEGYGLSMAEAMLAGVPVVATKTGLLESNPQFARIVEQDTTPKQWARVIHSDFTSGEQEARALVAKHGVDGVGRFASDWEALISRLASVGTG